MHIEKTVELHNKNVGYTLKVSKRAKRMRLSVYHDGRAVVTIPRMLPIGIVEKFLTQKSGWLLDKLDYFRRVQITPRRKVNDRGDFLKYKDQALLLAHERIVHFNKMYGYSWNKITIKNTKTRWGSCSKKGNLNFSYKIALLPQKMADYIIVHELCHLGEFNHSRNFWGLVAKTMPDYLEIRRELKKLAR